MAFNIVAGVNNAVYGSVSGSGSYVEGAEVTLEVTANDGYRFVSWDDGSTDNPRIFNASEDVTLVATLEIIPEYTVSVTVNDNSLGTVSGSGTFGEGASTQISATPYVHSRFVNWEDGNSDNPRTITVSAAAIYKAIFEAVNYFTISTDVNDADLGSVTGAGEYDEGDTVTLTAVPETDCRFVSWNDGNTDNPRIFTSSADATYIATFEEIQYTDVTIASNDVSWGTVSGATSGNIETGATITLTATPATDYKFDGWQVDGEIVSASLTASFLVDGQEMDIIAVFSAIVFYQVTLITNDVDCGSISVVSATAEPRGEAHNIWPDGTIINLQAVTTEGGRFLNWSTGQVATEITVNVHGNETIRANFYPATGLILVTKKIFQHAWNTIKSFFSAPTGASKIGAPANNALGATTLADVVNSVGQANGLAQLNEDGKINISDLGGSGSSGLDVDITGNAATATSADSADVAAKIGTATVGSSTEPVYINAGTPTACGGSLDVDITGNAATVTVDNTTYNGNRPIAMPAIEGIDTAATVQKKMLYSNNLYANPSTGVFTATGGIYSGNIHIKAAGSNYNEGIRIHPASGNSVAAIVFCGTDNTGDTGTSANTWELYTSNGRLGFYRNGSNTSASYYIQCATDGSWSMKGALTNSSGFVGNLTGNVTGNCSGSSGSCTGNAATATTAGNVTGTVAIAHGGTGATTRLNALKALTNENVGTNATYFLTITDSWGKGGYSSVANVKSVLGIPASGTIATTASNITGSSGSCTGNAATATTATNANNAKLTHTVGNTEYPLVFGSSFVVNDSQQALRIGTPSTTAAQCPLRAKAYCAAAKTQGEAYIVCGNNLAKASANNARGSIYLYGTSTAHTQIVPGNNSTSNVLITLPASTGTLALTSSNITGSATKWGGYALSVVTALPASPNASTIYLVK